ncbi:GNAT family N-acetyltransferase [Paraburkholderia sp. RL17-373-BIF-A]|uniref:GNAT family N-acetyltransferase n=1 Tax=Paraburkholderia sp. RL17-373-BIF-A TaxID=3031629 RepID=UPI0038B6BAF5
MSGSFHVAALDGAHAREAFDSGVDALDRYLRQQATQDQRRRVSSCFVALDGERIAGYYTLASASVALGDLPQLVAQRLPRYPTIPAVRMGRLAVDLAYRGRGLGAALLADALDRVLRADIAAWALLVDAKDDAAVAFYQHHGFVAFADIPRTLFLPVTTARAARDRS